MNKNLLTKITNFYLDSPDFNGIPLRVLREEFADDLLPTLKELVVSGNVSIVFGDGHENPHIRALPEHHTPERQAELLDTPLADNACVYPLPAHLKIVVDVSTLSDKPYTAALTLGEPQLAHRAFGLSILESYRNDPRYAYENNDIRGSISIRGEYFEKNNMPVSDQVLLQTFGFAYDDNENKYVAAEHQRMWQTREISRKTHLHPDYFRSSILGQFPERVSIYEAFIEELRTINKMTIAMRRPPLFRMDFAEQERPREFSSLLRPTARDYNDFVHLLDKLISDNINKAFFQGDIPYEDEHVRPDGRVEVRPRGTLRILADWIGQKFRPRDPEPVADMLRTFRELRKLRQKPAHAVDENRFDQRYIHDQRDLMVKAYDALRTLRLIITNHPAAKSVEVPDWLFEGRIWSG